jgi:hypothetical protein
MVGRMLSAVLLALVFVVGCVPRTPPPISFQGAVAVAGTNGVTEVPPPIPRGAAEPFGDFQMVPTVARTAAQAAPSEDRGLREDAIRRISKLEERADATDRTLADHERRIKTVEVDSASFKASLVEVYRKTDKLGEAQVRLVSRQSNQEILHGVRNSTAWKLQWDGDKLTPASQKIFDRLVVALNADQKLAMVVNFYSDMKTPGKCDVPLKRAQKIGKDLKASDSDVEIQPGREAETIVFTIRRPNGAVKLPPSV